MAWVTAHEFPEGDPKCRHCGGTTSTTCKPRLVDLPPRRMVSAVDDIDTIHNRIKELRAEQDAALKRETG